MSLFFKVSFEKSFLFCIFLSLQSFLSKTVSLETIFSYKSHIGLIPHSLPDDSFDKYLLTSIKNRKLNSPHITKKFCSVSCPIFLCYFLSIDTFSFKLDLINI